jgi:hypothetical protein
MGIGREVAISYTISEDVAVPWRPAAEEATRAAPLDQSGAQPDAADRTSTD